MRRARSTLLTVFEHFGILPVAKSNNIHVATYIYIYPMCNNYTCTYVCSYMAACRQLLNHAYLIESS